MAIFELIPACKDYIWGGAKLKTDYGKAYNGDRLAETWELSCHPDGLCRIANGSYAGKTLKEYIESEGKHVLGTDCEKYDYFPILIKLIDAKNNLSIQVHPDNDYALLHEGQYGKTEMWYVLEAGESAYLYHGFKHAISKEEFRQRIEAGTLLEVLNAVPVKKGDVCFIPSGTLHAICKDIVVAEIQQSSNVTYRIFDYNRLGADGKPRALHIEKAVDVTRCEPPRTDYDFGKHLACCDYFTVDAVDAPYTGVCDECSFVHVLVVEGEGMITNGNETQPIHKGSSLFLPAGSGSFTLDGSLHALITYV